MKQSISKIESKLKKVVKDLGFTASIKTVVEDDTVTFKLETKNPALLIGKDGEGLQALQHVLRILAGKEELCAGKLLVVDVNGYHERRFQYLTRLVEEAILKIKEPADSEILPPMSAFDRLFVHKLVTKRGFDSRSQGEGEDRRVVIKKS